MNINVNGIRISYEVIGQGRSLVFLHGNGEDHTIFNKLSERLKDKFEIYLIDSRNHGLSERTNVYDYGKMCDDIYELIIKLELKNAVVIGFSDGAIIGLMLAIKYPNLVEKLIFAGGNIRPNGIKLLVRKEINKVYQQSLNPLLKMMLDKPNISNKDLKLAVIPVLILVGELDVIHLSHTKMIYRNLKNASLEVIKNHTHDSYIVDSSFLERTILEFI